MAAVGEMAERPAVSEATLRAHDAVIRRLADTVDAILPVRFGSLLSESALTDALAVRGRELTEALALDRARLHVEQAAALDEFCPTPERWIDRLLARVCPGRASC